MSLPTAYLTTFKNSGEILQAIQTAQAPQRFTQRFLEGLGFPSNNDRTTINVLKALKFLDDAGVATKRYHEYLDQTRSAIVLAHGIREAYADLFRVNINAQNMSATEVKNKMKTLSEGQFTDRVLTQMAGTFTTLVKSADFVSTQGDLSGDVAKDQDKRGEEEEDERDGERSEDRRRRLRGDMARIGDLVYNVNIVLPESRDPAVYDALFKALREHLG